VSHPDRTHRKRYRRTGADKLRIDTGSGRYRHARIFRSKIWVVTLTIPAVEGETVPLKTSDIAEVLVILDKVVNERLINASISLDNLKRGENVIKPKTLRKALASWSKHVK